MNSQKIQVGMRDTRWDTRFLNLASHIASWSKDQSTKVGAVITNSKRIVSLGYNGFPQHTGHEMERCMAREERLARTIHAEKNAILFAARDLYCHTIYVTHPPCAQCAAMIIQSGIMEIIALEPGAAFVERWRSDIEISLDMYSQAGLKMFIYSPLFVKGEPVDDYIGTVYTP